MIPGQALQAWLSDGERQRGAIAAAQAFATDWNADPDRKRLEHALRSLSDSTAEAVAEAAIAFFGEEEWVATLIATIAEPLRDDAFFEPPIRTIRSDLHGGLLVFDSPCVDIALGVTRIADLAARKSSPRGSTSVSFTGQLTVLKFVGAGGATLSFWEAPEVTADFSAADAGRCGRTGERRIEDGETIVVDGRRQSYVIEHARANLVVLQAAVKRDQAPLVVEYDSRTGAYVGCSAADDSASRVQMIATLLRKLARADALPVLEGMLEHPDFFVRWHVMRELLGLDSAAALPHLKRMAARDPHADVRRTARDVLERIESGTLCRKAA